MSKDDFIKVEGKVIELLPKSQYMVLLDENNMKIRTTLSGKMRMNKINIVLGDRVSVEISPYDLTKGRISYRYKN